MRCRSAPLQANEDASPFHKSKAGVKLGWNHVSYNLSSRMGEGLFVVLENGVDRGVPQFFLLTKHLEE